MSVLSDETIDERLAGTDWRREDGAIVRTSPTVSP